MVTKIILLISFSFCLIHCVAQQSFCKVVGTNKDDIAQKMIQTNDHGFIVVGSSTSPLTFDEDGYIIKLDSTLNLEWTRTLRNSDTLHPGIVILDVIEDSNQNYFTVGLFMASSPALQMIASKWNPNGTLLWSKILHRTFYDYPYGALAAGDGGFIITGSTFNENPGSDDDDISIVKLDSNGNTIWSKIIGARGTGNDELGHSIVRCKDNGFAIGGSTTSFGKGSWDFYVVKMDSLFNIQWTRTIGTTEWEKANCLISTDDNGFLIVGEENFIQSSGQSDFYVVKLDSLGSLQWSKTIGGSSDEIALSAIQTKDSGYLVSGYTVSFGAGNLDGYIIKLNNSGALEWTKTMGGLKAEFISSAVQLTDESYVLTGEQNYLFGDNTSEIPIIKIDSNGNGCCVVNSSGSEGIGGAIDSGGIADTISFVSLNNGIAGSRGVLATKCITAIHETNNVSNLQVIGYFEGNNIHFSVQNLPNGKYTLRILDLLGQAILNQKINSVGLPVEYTFQMLVNSGAYFASIIDENGIRISLKVIKP